MDSNQRFLRSIYSSALITNIIGVLGGTVNVFFDGILVGQRLGDVGIAAVNQCLPVYLLLCTIGSIIASGACFSSAKEMGKKNAELSESYFSLAFELAIILGVVFGGICLLLLNPISRLVSAEETYEYVRAYLFVTLIGGFVKVGLYVPFFYLRLIGKNKLLTTAMLTMTVANIILDYVFMFILDWGITGASLASVIATAIAFVLTSVGVLCGKTKLRFRPVLPKPAMLGQMASLGMPMGLNNVLSAARVLIINVILKSMGISSILAVFAIVNNLNEISICIQNGIPQTAGVMTGLFYGERDFESIKKLLKIQLTYALVLSAVLGAAFVLLSGQISKWFGSDANILKAMICFAPSLILATINSTLSGYYNSIGKLSISSLMVLCRGFIFVVVFCLLFKPLGEYIWLFYPAAELMTLLAAIGYSFLFRAKNEVPFYLLRKSQEQNGSAISFSTDCSNENICDASARISEFCENNDFTPRQTMAISLAIEEILTIIAEKSLKNSGNMDVRVLKDADGGVIRIRSSGKYYNPVEMQDDSLDYMGVRMIEKLAQKIDYQSALGLNILIINI